MAFQGRIDKERWRENDSKISNRLKRGEFGMMDKKISGDAFFWALQGVCALHRKPSRTCWRANNWLRLTQQVSQELPTDIACTV